MTEIITVAGIAIISSGMIILLKQYKPEYAFTAALCSGILIVLYITGFLSEIFSFIKELIAISKIDKENFAILAKCMGIAVITKVAADACNDFGQGSVSSKVELAGKIIMLFCAIPLYKEILSIITNLIHI